MSDGLDGNGVIDLDPNRQKALQTAMQMQQQQQRFNESYAIANLCAGICNNSDKYQDGATADAILRVARSITLEFLNGCKTDTK